MQKDAAYMSEGYLNENFRLFHLQDNAGQERDYHFHEFDKIVILISGCVNYIVEDVECQMEPWDVVLVNHHTIHKAEIDRSVQYERVIIYLDARYIERSAPQGGLMSCFLTADRQRRFLIRPRGDDLERLKTLLAELESAMGDGEFGGEVMKTAAMLRLMVALNRMMLCQGDISPHAAIDPKIGAVQSYINENLTEDLSVDALAESAFMSRYHFMRLFKAQTGATVHSYIRQKRLTKAAQLIREGMPITKAAAECGFNDYSAFHRAFRDTFNISPAELKP